MNEECGSSCSFWDNDEHITWETRITNGLNRHYTKWKRESGAISSSFKNCHFKSVYFKAVVLRVRIKSIISVQAFQKFHLEAALWKNEHKEIQVSIRFLNGFFYLCNTLLNWILKNSCTITYMENFFPHYKFDFDFFMKLLFSSWMQNSYFKDLIFSRRNVYFFFKNTAENLQRSN